MSRREWLSNRGAENFPDTSVEGARTGFFTNRLELVNRAGKKIMAYLDRPAGRTFPPGVILIPPAYGETKENNLFISAYFATNGFHSLRFDWTDHTGESDGDLFTCTLGKMKDDLLGLLDCLEDRYPSMNTGILATSLAARVALKVAACDPRLHFLICFAPVVDVQYTLNAVYQEDLVGNYSKGKRYATLDVLGFSIDADGFLGDAVRGSFSDLSSSMDDASNIEVPTLFLVAEKDAWVRTGDARSVFQTIKTPRKRIFSIPTALHRLVENPVATGNALKQTIVFLFSNAHGRELGEEDVREPSLEEVHDREAKEKAYLRESFRFLRSEEQEFWKKYLSNFQYIINIHDYWNLLEFIYNLLGGGWPGQKILDAGCGNGNYGLFLLAKQMYKVRQNPLYLSMPPVGYFGVDFVWEAISEGVCKIKDLQDGFRQKMGLAYEQPGFVEASLILADLEAGIPFPDNFFDQVCCNLVVSYLQQPARVVHELCRVLRSSGKMIISSLKPNYDLSEIYRNFVSVAENDGEIEEARKLLSNAAMIRLKGARGIYHFYGEKELKQLARRGGLSRVKSFRSFGNQANIVVGWKA